MAKRSTQNDSGSEDVQWARKYVAGCIKTQEMLTFPDLTPVIAPADEVEKAVADVAKWSAKQRELEDRLIESAMPSTVNAQGQWELGQNAVRAVVAKRRQEYPERVAIEDHLNEEAEYSRLMGEFGHWDYQLQEWVLPQEALKEAMRNKQAVAVSALGEEPLSL